MAQPLPAAETSAYENTFRTLEKQARKLEPRNGDITAALATTITAGSPSRVLAGASMECARVYYVCGVASSPRS